MPKQNNKQGGEKKYRWAWWEEAGRHTISKNCKCDLCRNDAFRVAVAEELSPFDPEWEILRSRCKDHYNKQTQISWLRKWRNNHAKTK